MYCCWCRIVETLYGKCSFDAGEDRHSRGCSVTGAGQVRECKECTVPGTVLERNCWESAVTGVGEE